MQFSKLNGSVYTDETPLTRLHGGVGEVTQFGFLVW